jgi:hypothetical protein
MISNCFHGVDLHLIEVFVVGLQSWKGRRFFIILYLEEVIEGYNNYQSKIVLSTKREREYQGDVKPQKKQISIANLCERNSQHRIGIINLQGHPIKSKWWELCFRR